MKLGRKEKKQETEVIESKQTKLNPVEMHKKIFGTKYTFKLFRKLKARHVLLKHGIFTNIHSVSKEGGIRITWPLQESRIVDITEYILDLPEINILCAENYNVVLDPVIKVRVIDPIAAFNNSDNVFELVGVTLISALRPIIASMTFDQIKSSRLEERQEILEALAGLYQIDGHTTYGIDVKLEPFQKIDREDKMASVYSSVQESTQRVIIAENDAKAKRLVEEVPQDVALRLAEKYIKAGFTKEQAMNMVKTVALANSQANVVAVVGDGDSNVANAATLGAAFNAGGRNR